MSLISFHYSDSVQANAPSQRVSKRRTRKETTARGAWATSSDDSIAKTIAAEMTGTATVVAGDGMQHHVLSAGGAKTRPVSVCPTLVGTRRLGGHLRHQVRPCAIGGGTRRPLAGVHPRRT